MMAEANRPSTGRSTADAAFNEIRKQVARRNEETHNAARKVRTAREQEQIAQRRERDRH